MKTAKEASWQLLHEIAVFYIKGCNLKFFYLIKNYYYFQINHLRLRKFQIYPFYYLIRHVKTRLFRAIFLIHPLYCFRLQFLQQQSTGENLSVCRFQYKSSQIESLKDSLKKTISWALKFHYQSKWNPVVSIFTIEEIANTLKKS